MVQNYPLAVVALFKSDNADRCIGSCAEPDHYVLHKLSYEVELRPIFFLGAGRNHFYGLVLCFVYQGNTSRSAFFP